MNIIFKNLLIFRNIYLFKYLLIFRNSQQISSIWMFTFCNHARKKLVFCRKKILNRFHFLLLLLLNFLFKGYRELRKLTRKRASLWIMDCFKTFFTVLKYRKTKFLAIEMFQWVFRLLEKNLLYLKNKLFLLILATLC